MALIGRCPPTQSVIELVRGRLVLAAFCLATSACAAANNPSAATPSNPITIDVLGIHGARSFSPNPESLPEGQMVIWHNLDIYTHHIVLDDRSVDSGDLRPGASTEPMPIGAPGSYHCTIHPEMVGTITR
jgi:plastocyanin